MFLNPCCKSVMMLMTLRRSTRYTSVRYCEYIVSNSAIVYGRRNYCNNSSSSYSDDESTATFTESIPRHRVSLKFCRSSGPGGQNVNKVNTKVDLRFKVTTADWLPKRVRDNILLQQQHRITKDGDLNFATSTFRSQIQNIDEAFRKLEEMIHEANALPSLPDEARLKRIDKREKKADISRLQEKKKRSDLKKSRKNDW